MDEDGNELMRQQRAVALALRQPKRDPRVSVMMREPEVLAVKRNGGDEYRTVTEDADTGEFLTRRSPAVTESLYPDDAQKLIDQGYSYRRKPGQELAAEQELADLAIGLQPRRRPGAPKTPDQMVAELD